MKKILILSILAVAALSGCATGQPRPQLVGPTYSQFESRAAQATMFATVMTIRPVIIQGPNTSTSMGTGGSIAAGAVVGGALGSRGNARKNPIGTTLGGLLGGAVGSSVHDTLAEQERNKQGIELLVKLGDGTGRVLSVMQEVNNSERFAVGMTVSLIQQRGGYHASPL